MYIVTQCLSETLSHEVLVHQIRVRSYAGLVQTQWGRRDLGSIPLPEERTVMHCTALMQIEKRIRQTMTDCSHRLMKGQ